ncbi:hypothetical protein PACILC2_44570 [Paenibacillus cisolokensis]|uniref:Uncharacterized protein n=1 Tax=Paenibacillus cisolokensis TaxID=1658519 RepID=A0ABQ4NCE1_9BACL|nr:hypothetical protein [Paenibacillus cisolokensis]GIQ65889.1 hypothetical protein PACILC2_44570 [Paenibacillus cisolokensis]
MTNLTDREIIMRLSEEDADMMLSLAKRHLSAVKQLIGLISPLMGKDALEDEIKACRLERERILEKYR